MRERLELPGTRGGRPLPARPATGSGQSLRSLQRALGNRAMGRLVRRTLQRDLTNTEKVKEGEFKLDLKTQSNAGAKSGLQGTITFHAADTAPDSTKIRLYQTARLEDLTTGKDYVWTGAHATRTAIQTAADPTRGIEGGWGIDVDPTKVTPRTARADPAVSPYYRDYWPNVTKSQDGSKAGKTIVDASLWDYPGWNANGRFSFETVAKATDTGHVYGTVKWGFTISDAAKGTVDHEYASGRNVPTATTNAAMKAFDEYLRNPGASTAPTK